MSKLPRRAHTPAVFTSKNTELTSSKQVVHKSKRAGYTDGVIGGERVIIATPPKGESEKSVEIQVRVALAAAGVMVMKHTVEICYQCGARPSRRAGLGTGCSDLVCIVPPFGRALFIEMKKPKGGVVSEEQKLFLAVVRRFGGVSGRARSVDEAMALVEEARRG